MLKQHIRVLFGHGDDRIHIAERGGKDHVVAFLGIVTDNPLGVRALGDYFAKGGLDIGQLFQGQPPLIVSIAPAQVAHGADVDKGDFQLLFFLSHHLDLFAHRLLGGLTKTFGSFGGSLAYHALDEVIHAQHLFVGQAVAFGHHQGPVSAHDRSAEDVPLTGG